MRDLQKLRVPSGRAQHLVRSRIAIVDRYAATFVADRNETVQEGTS